MKGVWIVIGLVAAGLGGMKYWGGSAAGGGTAQIAAEATAAARRAALPIAISESGYLKAKNSTNLQPQFQGGATITWLVKEGKSVEKDEVLVEFDKVQLQTQFDDKTNLLHQFRTELAGAQAEHAIQQRDSTAALGKAQFELDVAKMKLDLYEKGESPNETRKKRLAAEKAHSEFKRATEQFEKVPELLAQGFLTKIQAEEERIRLREKEIEVENADKDLELYETYTLPMGAAEKKNALADAERNLENAQAREEIKLKEREGRITEIEGKVHSTEAQLTQLQKNLDFMTIKAPRAGIVYYGDPAEPWMHEQVKVGNRFNQGNTLVTLPDLREMQVLIQVHEADIDSVKLEQPVIITLESQKERAFPAKVTRIGAVANSNWGNPENKTFEIEITMEPIEIELRAGTTAKAEIQVETVPEALQVPVQSVLGEGAEHLVFVALERGFEKRVVKIGKSNNHFVQVLEGLQEGERVLLYDPRGAGAEASPDAPRAGSASPAAAPGGTAQQP
jgi:HlyD family secretion protein